MWVSKKEWLDLQTRLDKVEFELQTQPSVNNVVTQYVGNEILHQELQIFLSGPDLYKLQNQRFYPELMKFLDNVQTQRSTTRPAEKRS